MLPDADVMSMGKQVIRSKGYFDGEFMKNKLRFRRPGERKRDRFGARCLAALPREQRTELVGPVRGQRCAPCSAILLHTLPMPAQCGYDSIYAEGHRGPRRIPWIPRQSSVSPMSGRWQKYRTKNPVG